MKILLCCLAAFLIIGCVVNVLFCKYLSFLFRENGKFRAELLKENSNALREALSIKAEAEKMKAQAETLMEGNRLLYDIRKKAIDQKS